jgi:putative flippase GtrA
MENNEKNTENSSQLNKKLEKKALSREVVTYLIFGVLTTFVGWAVYFAIMLGGRAMLSIPNEDTTSGAYIGLYTAAQLIQWVCAVLFAFFTNRKWVFTEADKSKKILPQLLTFSGGRVITLGLDYVITLVGAMALTALLPALNSVSIIGITLNFNEVAAKVAAAFVVIVCNYIFSKIFVFKKKKD